MTAATAFKVGPRGGGSYGERAAARWGAELPDWVQVLAKAADSYVAMRRGVRPLAQLLDVSVAMISAVIGKTYTGGYSRIAERVRGKLMSQTVACPAAGMDIARDQCAANQVRKASSANPLAAKFPAACKACENRFGETAHA